MVSYYCAAVALSLRDVGLDLETRVLSHSRSLDRETDTVLSAEIKVRKLTVSLCYMVPNLATPTQAFSLIFIYFNSSFRCLLVRVSGNMKKKGHAVAGISSSFCFINFC